MRIITTLFAMLFAIIPFPARGQGQVIVEKSIEYSNPDNQHLQLDMARPTATTGLLPAIICIHGGGFRAGSRDGYLGLIQQLAAKGYVAVTVSYRLAPKYPFPAAVNDVKAAVRWLRTNAAKYNIDPNRIGVTGGSAGGHLALYLGVTGNVPSLDGDGGNPGVSSAVQCVVNVYGPSDFTKSYGKSVDAAEVLPLFLGGNVEQQRKRHLEASPLYWVTPSAPPTLCIHGTQDKYVAYEQSIWMVDRLLAAGCDAELATISGGGHGFNPDQSKQADAALFAWFDKYLKPGK